MAHQALKVDVSGTIEEPRVGPGMFVQAAKAPIKRTKSIRRTSSTRASASRPMKIDDIFAPRNHKADLYRNDKENLNLSNAAKQVLQEEEAILPPTIRMKLHKRVPSAKDLSMRAQTPK